MNWSKKKRLFVVVDILMAVFLIFLDQITKYFAVTYLKDQPPHSIIDGIFELRYLENRGAAFGMLQDQKIFFIIVSIIVLISIIYILIKIPDDKKYNCLHFLLVLIASGAIGNMIDRIRLEYVVDFFYFVLINFPIFNVADIYVSVSCVLLAFMMIFIFKEEDLDFIQFKSKDREKK